MTSRTDFLERLQLTAPALLNGSMIPILNHFWFTGTHLVAYNDQIGISTPMETSFQSAVPGDILVNMVKNSRAKEVEFELRDDKELRIKLGRTHLKFATLPAKDFVFTMPAPDKDALIPAPTKPFLDAVGGCLRSVGNDTQTPEYLGITLAFQDSTISVYATNGRTISRSQVTAKGTLPKIPSVILSTAFCQEILRLVGPEDRLRLELHKDYVLLVTAKATVFGRLVTSEKPLDFAGQIERHFPQTQRQRLVPIPARLRLVLERAIISTESTVSTGTTDVLIEGGKARFLSKSSDGDRQVVDTIRFDNHPDVAVGLQPRLLKLGLDDFDNMLVTDRCTVMVRGKDLFMVAARGS